MDTDNEYLNLIILSVLFFKILSMIMISISFYFHYTDSKYQYFTDEVEHYIHLLFTINIGILMIYLFHHYTPKKVCIQGHTKLYLYLFGIISILGGLKKIVYNMLTTSKLQNNIIAEYLDIVIQ